MTLFELTKAKKILDEVSEVPGIEFAYAVFKNKQLINKKLIELEFIKNVSSQVIEYEEKRISLCEELSDKDENGKPIIENNIYLIKDKEEFKKRMEVLMSEYSPFVEERKKQVDLFNQKMNSIVDVEFFKITKDQLPPQIQTAKDLDRLSFMIE